LLAGILLASFSNFSANPYPDIPLSPSSGFGCLLSVVGVWGGVGIARQSFRLRRCGWPV
jgi:hypothetical protein